MKIIAVLSGSGVSLDTVAPPATLRISHALHCWPHSVSRQFRIIHLKMIPTRISAYKTHYTLHYLTI